MIKKVSSPYLTEADEDPKGERPKGRLGPIAAKVLMKILYAARVVRFDRLKGDPAVSHAHSHLDVLVRQGAPSACVLSAPLA